VERQIFAVLGFVTGNGEARTAGIVYTTRDGEIFIATDRDSWKAKHTAKNPRVSLTVTIPKRIPFMPWIRIPPATVTFQGDAAVCAPDTVAADVRRRLLRGLELDPALTDRIAIIRIKPRGDFVTYGVGVSLPAMRHPEKARGRVPVP